MDELLAKDELLPNRVFIFTSTPDGDFGSTLPDRMRRDGVHRHLHFVALSASEDPEDGYNVFVALDTNSDAQARLLARKYFHSTLAIGRVMGPLGLKHL